MAPKSGTKGLSRPGRLESPVTLWTNGSWARLSDGSVARVIAANRNHYTKPVVSVVIDLKGKVLASTVAVDLAAGRNKDLSIAEAVKTPVLEGEDLRSVGYTS